MTRMESGKKPAVNAVRELGEDNLARLGVDSVSRELLVGCCRDSFRHFWWVQLLIKLQVGSHVDVRGGAEVNHQVVSVLVSVCVVG